MIPKKIHYCWFGRNELPETAKKCIDSWKKYFPEYEIIQWNEDNYNVRKNDYIREAYEKKSMHLYQIMQDSMYCIGMEACILTQM